MKCSTAVLVMVAWMLPHGLLDAQQLSTGAGIGVGKDTWRAEIHGQVDYPIGARLRLAGGLRLTRYGGSGRALGGQGSASGSFPASLTLDPSVWGLNLMVAIEGRVLGTISAGANLDVVGIAGGPAVSQGSLDIRPARFSMFRYGNADRGSLNSEFYLAARITPRLTIRSGLSHFVVGYEVEHEANVRRYLRFDDALFVALRWTPRSGIGTP